MAHKISMQELIDQKFNIETVVASSSEDNKKLVLVARIENDFDPLYAVICKSRKVYVSRHLLLAINEYNQA